MGVVIWGVFFGVQSPKELDKEIKQKERELKHYQIDQKFYPSKEAYIVLEKINERLKNDLIRLQEVSQKTDFPIPEGATVDGLFFRERLFKIDKELHLLASEHGTVLPENLGFSDELPDVKRVRLMLHQLLVIRETSRAFIESGAETLSVIKPLQLSEYKDPETGEIIFIELPIQISTECSSQTLFKALVGLRNDSQIIIVRELHIKTKNEGMLQISLVVSGFFIKS